MAFSHYIDVMIREAGISHELHARLLIGLHYQIVNDGKALAVAWPDWKATMGEFGLVFRAFGSPEALEGFGQIVEPLASSGLVRLYPITPVPEISKQVAYLRDRVLDRRSPSRVRREMARAEARGRDCVIAPFPSQGRISHFLKIASTTNGQPFRMFVVRQDRLSADMGGGRRYGLGHLLPDF